MCKFLYIGMFLILLGISLGVQLMDGMVTPCFLLLFFFQLPDCFSKQLLLLVRNLHDSFNCLFNDYVLEHLWALFWVLGIQQRANRQLIWRKDKTGVWGGVQALENITEKRDI